MPIWGQRARVNFGALSDEALVKAALDGDTQGLRALVDRLSPIVSRRVTWITKNKRSGRQEVIDHIQNVFVVLLEQNGRVLRSWQPERGTLSAFVGIVAERVVYAFYRSGQRSQSIEDLTADGGVPAVADVRADIDIQCDDRDLLQKLLGRLKAELSPKSYEIFSALYIEELPPELVAERWGMTVNALYTWRSRCRQQVLAIYHELTQAGGAP